MVSCECACVNLISRANFNLINRTDLIICYQIMFQISFQNSKGQKSYRKFLGVWSELLLSIYWLICRTEEARDQPDDPWLQGENLYHSLRKHVHVIYCNFYGCKNENFRLNCDIFLILLKI